MTRTLSVCFVTVNTFEYDSRTLRAARALAADGHRVTVVAQRRPGLPRTETLDGGIRVVRPDVDRRISNAFSWRKGRLRDVLSRAIGLDPEAIVLPLRGTWPLERIRAPLRRGAEILAYRQRVRPWAAAVVEAAPADIYSAKALVALPVVREAAHRAGGRFVYDIADLHVESGRLAHLPGLVKAYLSRREGRWMADAAGLIAVTDPLADEVVRRFCVPRPTVVMNCRPRWRPDLAGLPKSSRLRDAIAATTGRASPADVPIVLYQGAFREDQGIEELLPALSAAPLRDVPLVMAFLGFGRMEPRLRAAAAADPDRIVVLPPVPSEDLLDWTAGATLSFVGAPPKTINLALTIPNKLFESLMAGVPVVVSGGTAVAALVEGSKVGIVVEPWSSETLGTALAVALQAPLAEHTALRERARSAALERYNAETEQAGVVALYRRLADAS
jgi:glycosyltransferase involved in cell wall biosynthesis